MLATQALDYLRRLEARTFSPFVVHSNIGPGNDDAMNSKLRAKKKTIPRHRKAFQHAFTLKDCNISFLDIAYAALSCDMLAEALLYVEIHMKTAIETNPASSSQCSIDDLYNIPNHIKVLHQVYTKLRDIDGKSNSVFHGLGVENENMYNN